MARPKKAKVDTPKNGPDPETEASYFRKLERSLDDVAEAKIPFDAERGRHRALCKAAKADGCDVEALLWAIRARRRSATDVESEMKNRMRIAKLMQLPIGTQFDLFGVEVPVQVSEDNARYYAKRAGIQAGKRGEHRHDSNPHPAGSELFVAFDDGWVEGQTAIVETMQPTPQPSGEPRKGAGAEMAAA